MLLAVNGPRQTFLSVHLRPIPTIRFQCVLSQAASRPRYNRTVKRSFLLAALPGLAVALLCGCKKNIQNDDAVKQGIQNYLSKRGDLLAMDVKVESVAYHQNEATATVRFQAKGNSAPQAGMTMAYVLERQGSQWVVKGRAGAPDGSPHTGIPQGSDGSSPTGALPPGHPAIGSNGAANPSGLGSIGAMPNMPPPNNSGAPSGALPQGHPPIGSSKSPDNK